jgi:hypothetical protein
MLSNCLFLSKAASVQISQLLTYTCWSLKVAGVSLDVIVQLFCHDNTREFLLWPLERGKCNTCCLTITPR